MKNYPVFKELNRGKHIRPLTLCGPKTPLHVPLQTLKTQMKCRIMQNLIISFDPLIYTIDHPYCIVSSFWGNVMV